MWFFLFSFKLPLFLQINKCCKYFEQIINYWPKIQNTKLDPNLNFPSLMKSSVSFMLWVLSKNFHFEVFVLHLSITEQQASNTTKIYFFWGGGKKRSTISEVLFIKAILLSSSNKFWFTFKASFLFYFKDWGMQKLCICKLIPTS